MIQDTISYHNPINAQPAHEQQLPFPVCQLPVIVNSPSFYAEHGVEWCGASLWPVPASCPGHAPPLFLVHLGTGRAWKNEKPSIPCVINIIFTLHPKYWTGPATKKIIKSPPDETRTGKGTASRHSTGKWRSSSLQESCGRDVCAHHPNVCFKGSKVRFQEGRRWIHLLCSYHYYGLFCINNNPLLPFYSRCNKLYFYERLVPQLCFCISSARAAVHYFVYFKASEIITKTDIKTCGGVSNHFSRGKTDSFALLKYCNMFKYFFDKCGALCHFRLVQRQ